MGNNMSEKKKVKEYGPKVKLLDKCINKYKTDKIELKARMKAFATYTDAIEVQIAAAKTMEIVCKSFLSPWTVHMLYIRDLYIKVYMGSCLRESFEISDKDFIDKLKTKDRIKPGSEDFCDGMDLFPFSICSNFGITRFLSTINQDAYGCDRVAETFECNDEDFAKVRSALNDCTVQIEKVLRAKPNVESATISKLLPSCVLKFFSVVIVQKTGGKVNWDYDAKQGKDSLKPAQEYVIYSSTNKVLFKVEVFPEVLVHRKKPMWEASSLEYRPATVTPAVLAEPSALVANIHRKVRPIVTSPDSECSAAGPSQSTTTTRSTLDVACVLAHTVEHKQLTAVSYVFKDNNPTEAEELEANSSPQQDDSSLNTTAATENLYTERLISTVQSSPDCSGLPKVAENGQAHTSTPIDVTITTPPSNASYFLDNKTTLPLPIKKGNEGRDNIIDIDTSSDKTSPPLKRAFSHEEYCGEKLMLATSLAINNKISAGDETVSSFSSDSATSIIPAFGQLMNCSEEYVVMDVNQQGGELDNYDDDCMVPTSIEASITFSGLHHSQMDDQQFLHRMYGLLVDSLRQGIVLESILTSYFRHRVANDLDCAGIDWMAFGNLLSEFAIEQFGTSVAPDGLQRTVSKCDRETPQELRVRMTDEEYAANRNLNRRVFAATKKIIKGVVVFWDVLVKTKSSGGPLVLNKLNKQARSFYNTVIGNNSSGEENIFITAIKNTSENTIRQLNQILNLSKYNYTKLPKTHAKGLEMVNKKEQEEKLKDLERLSQENDTEDDPKTAVKSTYSSRFCDIDDDAQLVNEYDKKSAKKKSATPTLGAQEAVAKYKGSVDSDEDEFHGPDDNTHLWENQDQADAEQEEQHAQNQYDAGDEDYNDNSFGVDEKPNSPLSDHWTTPQGKTSGTTRDTSESKISVGTDPSNTSSHSGNTVVSRRDAKNFFMTLTELSNPNTLNLQWAVDMFLDAVTSSPESVVSMTDLLMLKEVLPDSSWEVWSNAVYNARRLCEKIGIEYESGSETLRLRLMQVFAHTSIEDAVMKKVMLPLMVKFQGNSVLDTPLCYGGNKAFRFVLLRYRQTHECMDGLIEARQFQTSFSFFHTERFQEKLKRALAHEKQSQESDE